MLFSGASIPAAEALWRQVPIGAGGYVTSINIANDGTKVCRTDVGGGYIWDVALGRWRQLVTISGMPASYVPTNGPTNTQINFLGGVWEVVLAPNLSSRIFMNKSGLIYRSDDSGHAFVLTQFPSNAGTNANSFVSKLCNDKVAVDPNNSDIVYAWSTTPGTPGLMVSFDGGIASAWTTVSAVTAGTDPGGIITFGPSSETVVVGGQTRTAKIYVGSFGHGVWRSTDGGVTWADITGASGIVSVFTAAVSSTGRYFCLTTNPATGLIYRYDGAWATMVADGAYTQPAAICPDPKIAGRLVAIQGASGAKHGDVTLNCDDAVPVWTDFAWSWTGTGGYVKNVATDIPWLQFGAGGAGSGDASFLSTGAARFDPTVDVVQITGNLTNASPNVTNISDMAGIVAGQFIQQNIIGSSNKIAGRATILSVDVGASSLVMSVNASGTVTGTPLICNFANLFMAEGVGVWKAAWPTRLRPFDWVSQSAGIEELVSTKVLSPPGGTPQFLFWDRGIFNGIDLDNYPSEYGPATNGAGFHAAWDGDYASSDPTFICVNCQDTVSGADRSGYSTDGGLNWQPFTNLPWGGTKITGCIAAATPDNIVYIRGQNGGIVYTKDRGATAWVACPGLPTTGWVNFAKYPKILVADRVINGGGFYSFYAYFFDQTTPSNSILYRSIDGGDTWTQRFNGQLSTGDGNAAILAVSPSNAGHLWYTSGAIVGSGSTPSPNYLKRSTDGGTTWSTLSVAGGFAHDVQEVLAFGFGMAKPGGSGYPALYIAGFIDGDWGIWRSDDEGANWTQLAQYPNDSLDLIITVSGDMNIYGRCYVGFQGTGFAYYG